MNRFYRVLPLAAWLLLAASANAQAPPGEEPALDPHRITQADIESGSVSFDEIRKAGLVMFTTPFNKLDGMGDGPLDPFNPDKTSPGNRPTLQNNGTSLRINGNDSQTCLECHAILSNAVIPSSFGVAGVGGIAAAAMPGPTEIDIDDSDNNGYAFYNGRYINPPFVFGAGGVELLAKEMTADLQEAKAKAEDNPDVYVPLLTKGVSFGSILYDSLTGTFDTTLVVGVDPDLVVRPFGRKGNNGSIRKFDIGAIQFHQGMQPEEIVDDLDGDGLPDPGVDRDADGDGVVNEILEGDLSALHIFSVALEPPRMEPSVTPVVPPGLVIFNDIGCATCHIPFLTTDSRLLPIAHPEVETDPWANVFYRVNLAKSPPRFRRFGGGVRVDLFADLKRHDMGDDLAESTGGPLDRFFTTARLWGVADTAPYMHDGRALTLTEAIELHGGEAAFAATNFGFLSDSEKIDLLTFLRTLRVPKNPAGDLLESPVL